MTQALERVGVLNPYNSRLFQLIGDTEKRCGRLIATRPAETQRIKDWLAIAGPAIRQIEAVLNDHYCSHFDREGKLIDGSLNLDTVKTQNLGDVLDLFRTLAGQAGVKQSLVAFYQNNNAALEYGNPGIAGHDFNHALRVLNKSLTLFISMILNPDIDRIFSYDDLVVVILIALYHDAAQSIATKKEHAEAGAYLVAQSLTSLGRNKASLEIRKRVIKGVHAHESTGFMQSLNGNRNSLIEDWIQLEAIPGGATQLGALDVISTSACLSQSKRNTDFGGLLVAVADELEQSSARLRPLHPYNLEPEYPKFHKKIADIRIDIKPGQQPSLVFVLHPRAFKTQEQLNKYVLIIQKLLFGRKTALFGSSMAAITGWSDFLFEVEMAPPEIVRKMDLRAAEIKKPENQRIDYSTEPDNDLIQEVEGKITAIHHMLDEAQTHRSLQSLRERMNTQTTLEDRMKGLQTGIMERNFA